MVNKRVQERIKNIFRLSFLSFFFFRAQSYAERLRLGLAVIHGEAQCSESDMADGRHSPPCVRNTTGHTGLELPCKNTHLCRVQLKLLRISLQICMPKASQILPVQKKYPCFLLVIVRCLFICHSVVKFSKKHLIISTSSLTS